MATSNIDISLLGEALQQAIRESRTASPTTPEEQSPLGSDTSDTPLPSRRRTMAAERPAPAPEAPYPVARPKAPTLETFNGSRNKLRGWLASLTVYYRTVGWNEGHDKDKIAYTCSLLRDAGVWLIPYAEELAQPGSNAWEEVKTELKQLFGAVD